MVRPLNEDISVFGLFGFPLSHTRSPQMQNAALRALGIPGMYFAFERNPKQFLKLLKGGKKFILDGFNLTVPHKEIILPYIDRLDDSAKSVGAVNTVKRIQNKWIGYNTDVYGFSKSLSEAGFNTRGKKAVLLGAGGASRSVIVALISLKVKEIVIYNRTLSKGKRLAGQFQKKSKQTKIRTVRNLSDLRRELESSNLLINATSLGLKPNDASPIPAAFLPKKKLVAVDLIYGKKTKFLQAAKKLGYKTIDGEGMLLHQGARAFEIWTGKKAPIAVMRKALRD